MWCHRRQVSRAGRNSDILLVPPDFSESDSSGPVPVGLLNTTGSLGRGRLSSSLGSDCESVHDT